MWLIAPDLPAIALHALSTLQPLDHEKLNWLPAVNLKAILSLLFIQIHTTLTPAMNPENTNETPKRRTLPEAAKPYRWKKGGPSPNPGGRPKTAHISEALRRALEKGEAEQVASILLALASGEKKGNSVQIAALREIADRTEGKPHQSIEVDANINQKLGERLEKARKRKHESIAAKATP